MPGGQPTKYTPELADNVCQHIMAGLTLRQIADEPDIPVTWRTISNWLLKNDEFFHQHARARSVQAWGEVDDMIKLADEADPKTVNVKRLQVDVRKFRAERFNRAAFGDKREVKHTGTVQHAHLHASIDSRTDAALGISSTPKLAGQGSTQSE